MAASSWCNILLLYLTAIICTPDIILAKKNEEFNKKPTIGVAVMKITDPTFQKVNPRVKGRNYIASSYIKMIEMTGAQAVPVFYEQGIDEWRKIFDSVNAFLFPGGEVNLINSGYFNLTKKIFEWAKEANDQGDVFPIFGICRGMQALMTYTFGTLAPLELTDARNYTTTLTWDKKELSTSIFSDIPKKIIDYSEQLDITSHFHKYGIPYTTHGKFKTLHENFKVIATSIDRNGKEFLSIIQGRKYPFYGVQFHPEKPLFEFAPSLSIPHSKEAIRLSQHIINDFGEEARKNTKHSFESYEECQNYGIYKQPTVYTGMLKDSHTPFMQVYIF